MKTIKKSSRYPINTDQHLMAYLGAKEDKSFGMPMPDNCNKIGAPNAPADKITSRRANIL